MEFSIKKNTKMQTATKTENPTKRTTNRKPGARAASVRPVGYIETEADVRRQLYSLLNTLKNRYDGLYWRFDYSGTHIENTDERAQIHALNMKGWPDVAVFYAGKVLFLELKNSGVNPGTLLHPTTQHAAEQLAMLTELRSAGFSAGFAVGYHAAYTKLFAFLDGRPVVLL